MKLQDGKIILETRTDIDLMQNMIELLNEKGNIGKKEEEMLKQLNRELEALWYSWQNIWCGICFEKRIAKVKDSEYNGDRKGATAVSGLPENRIISE